MRSAITSGPRASWRRKALGVIRRLTPIVVACGASLSPAVAQTTSAVGVAKASEYLIKNYDPLVRSVSVVVPAPPGTQSACAKENKSQNGDWEAYYCRYDRKILISQRNLDLIERQFGYEAIATLVAHEMAHARQHAVTGFLSDVAWTAVFDELQADCIAGVYMRRATPVELSPSMVERSKQFLQAIGDYSFQERNWHGTPQMRGKAFDHGYTKGNLDACLASGEVNWKRVLNSTPSTVDGVIERAPEILDNLLNKGLKFLNSL